MLRIKIHGKLIIAVFDVVGCELGVIQQYNIYSKTATFFEKSGGFTHLGLAAALVAWYNNIESYINQNFRCEKVKEVCR